jgi:hypothetical protein
MPRGVARTSRPSRMTSGNAHRVHFGSLICDVPRRMGLLFIDRFFQFSDNTKPTEF